MSFAIDAVAKRANDLRIAPATESRFLVGREIRRARDADAPVSKLASAAQRGVGIRWIRAMTTAANRGVANEIFASLNGAIARRRCRRQRHVGVSASEQKRRKKQAAKLHGRCVLHEKHQLSKDSLQSP